MTTRTSNYVTHTILRRQATLGKPDLCVFCDCVDNELYENPCVTLQPESSSQVTTPVWPPPGGHIEWVVKLAHPSNRKAGSLSLYQCNICNALVVEDFMPQHESWHKLMRHR